MIPLWDYNKHMENLKTAINKIGNKEDAIEFNEVCRYGNTKTGFIKMSEFCAKMWGKYGDDIFIKTAIAEYERFAKKNASLIYRLGVKYSLGEFDENIPFIQSYEKAYECFDKISDENDDAMYMLGEMYEYGHYVNKDEEKAIYWYKKAYDNENMDAIYKLAMYYYNIAESGDTESNLGNYERALELFNEYDSKVDDDTKNETMIAEIESVLSDKDDDE